MKVAIKTAPAVKYGAQIATYFIAILFITTLPMIAGVGLMYTAIGSPTTVSAVTTGLTTQPNILLLAVGALTFIVGLILKLIGLLGGIFKLIADATYYGKINSHGHRA